MERTLTFEEAEASGKLRDNTSLPDRAGVYVVYWNKEPFYLAYKDEKWSYGDEVWEKGSYERACDKLVEGFSPWPGWRGAMTPFHWITNAPELFD